MKSCLFLLFVLTLPTSGQVNTVPILDKSGFVNLIQTKGEATFAESVETTSPRCADLHEPRCLVVSIRDQVECRNLSGRPILAFVVVVHYASSYGSGLEENKLVDVNLFSTEFFDPEDVFSLPDNQHGTMIIPLRTIEQRGMPRAEVGAVFVQFADGATAGDSKEGQELRRMLKDEWAALSGLDHVYAAHGRAKFMVALEKAKLPFELGFDRGIESNPEAIDQIHAKVLRAEERLARIDIETGVK
jgi:hypothetical protein